MRHAKSNYPVGATWRIDKKGLTGTLWLAERMYNFEVWRWSVFSSADKSGLRFDQCYSKTSARNELPITGRMKRIK